MNALVSGRDITGLRSRHSLQLRWCLSCGASPVYFHTKIFRTRYIGQAPLCTWRQHIILAHGVEGWIHFLLIVMSSFVQALPHSGRRLPATGQWPPARARCDGSSKTGRLMQPSHLDTLGSTTAPPILSCLRFLEVKDVHTAMRSVAMLQDYDL